MRRLIIGLVLLAMVPVSALALNTTDLLATIAMPLAVAAVSNVANVPQDQLANLVTTLNQANVPPVQFVRVIRYVPVALVDQNGQPFIAYVRQETDQGVTGDALASAIVDRLHTNYNVTPELTFDATPTYVVSNAYIPTTVVTQLGTPTTTLTSDPLAAIALPLAVAAVSNISGVPQDQLANLVATLNQANMPVVQEVQVIRYVPVALVDSNGNFVQFVQQQVSSGVTGTALMPVVTQQLQTYYPAQTITVSAPVQRPVVVERDFLPPPIAVTRVQEFRANPHGGPPGQIKKQLGLQTGAEVVHGVKPGHQFNPPPPVPVAVAPPPRVEHGHGHAEGGEGHGHGKGHMKNVPMTSAAPPPVVVAQPPVAVAPAPAAEKGHGPEGHGPEGGPPGQAKQKGGKGHGKD